MKLNQQLTSILDLKIEKLQAKNSFYQELAARIKTLDNLANTHIKDNFLAEPLSCLAEHLYIITLELINNKPMYSAHTQKNIAANILELIKGCELIINNPYDKKNFVKLKKLGLSNAFELRKHRNFGKHSLLATGDLIINTVNGIRGFIFQTDYGRSTFAYKNQISAPLSDFLLHVPVTQATTMQLDLILPTNSAEADAYLNPTIIEQLKSQKKFNKKTQAARENLIAALNNFAKATITASTTSSTIARPSQKAFLVSQDMVLQLLRKKRFNISEMNRLAACLGKAAFMINNPGQKKAAIELESLVKRCDNNFFHCDREKTSYAVLHIVASFSLLLLAISEVVLSHGASLALHIWSILAESSSLLVGVGQLAHFSNSQSKETLFSSSMQELINVTRLTSILPATEKLTKAEHDLEQALLCFQNKLRPQSDDIIHLQSQELLYHAREVAKDLQARRPLPIIKIKQLTATIKAAERLFVNPDEKNAKDLLKLLNDADYEFKRINKSKVFIAAGLAFISLILFAITIPSTVITHGITSGTVLSPIMIAVLACKQWSERYIPEKTLFTREGMKFFKLATVLESVNTLPETFAVNTTATEV